MQRTRMRVNGARGEDIERENNGVAHGGRHIKMPYGNKGRDTFRTARGSFMECWQFFGTISHILSKEKDIKFHEWIPDSKWLPALKIVVSFYNCNPQNGIFFSLRTG